MIWPFNKQSKYRIVETDSRYIPQVWDCGIWGGIAGGNLETWLSMENQRLYCAVETPEMARAVIDRFRVTVVEYIE